MRKREHNSKVPAEIAPILAEVKKRLGTYYGDRLVDLVLFGSRARCDNEPDSDIDVLAVLRMSADEVEQVSYPTSIIMDLLDRYGLLVTILEIDEGRYLTRGGPLLRNIRQEGVTVE